jgi:MFS family permease
VISLASLGGSLEYYDFVIYGIFAQYIARQFFPASDPYVSLSFSVLALGFLVRPLGIPTIRDRVVQTAAQLVLEPIFEADLDPAVHGYRPWRKRVRCHQRGACFAPARLPRCGGCRTCRNTSRQSRIRI